MNNFDTYLLTVQQLSARSQAAYRSYLAHWQAWVSQQGLVVESLTYADLLLFMQACQAKGYHKSHINSHLRVIRYYFDYLMSIQGLAYNPATNLYMRGIKRGIPQGLLDRDALDQLYEAYPTAGEKKLGNKVLVGLLVFQAPTLSELLQLHPTHIQLSKGLIDLPGSTRREERSLKLEASQMIPLQTYLSLLAGEQPLFTDRGSEKQLGNRLMGLMAELRLINPEVRHASQLRQSVITEWLKIKDIRYVQQWAGHRYVSSTERYQTQNLAALQADLNRFHPLQ
jgi:integrase/recombinase XerD